MTVNVRHSNYRSIVVGEIFWPNFLLLKINLLRLIAACSDNEDRAVAAAFLVGCVGHRAVKETSRNSTMHGEGPQ